MAEPVPFFLVWREGGGAPTMKHGDRDGAAAEAERLARLNPGERFFVMAAVECVERTDIKRTRFSPFDLDEMVPF